jgi:hypothetical protein
MRRLLLPFILAALAGSATAQDDLGSAPRIHLGVGVLPGTGGIVGYAAPRLSVLTVEGALYADYTGALDLDLGLRLGPSFYYAFFERSAEEEARSFRVMLDTFARGTYRLGGGRVVFVEVGSQAPGLRGGLSVGL